MAQAYAAVDAETRRIGAIASLVTAHARSPPALPVRRAGYACLIDAAARLMTAPVLSFCMVTCLLSCSRWVEVFYAWRPFHLHLDRRPRIDDLEPGKLEVAQVARHQRQDRQVQRLAPAAFEPGHHAGIGRTAPQFRHDVRVDQVAQSGTSRPGLRSRGNSMSSASARGERRMKSGSDSPVSTRRS